MAEQRSLILDANIFVRCVFGIQAFLLFDEYLDSSRYFTADSCVTEARRNVDRLASRRPERTRQYLAKLDRLIEDVEVIPPDDYAEFEHSARLRIPRDPSDWPIIATALLLDCPIWTEDRDFFGCGIATWTTSTVELYLQDA